MSKINSGNFFEDFNLGDRIIHPLPRTITDGDVSLYIALTGSRYALHASDTFAKSIGYQKRPLDDLLLFHITFGKSVNEISLNAIANLGYAEVHFRQPCYVGDTIRTESEIIGLKENSNGRSGNVYVHSQGYNQRDELILTLKRWVMVRKKDGSTSNGIREIPVLQKALPADLPINLPTISKIEPHLSGSSYFWEDYTVGERLNHPDGITIDNSDHTLATKLYQNNAKIHFNAHMMQKSPMEERLIYGGHIISLCRSISFNGLGNAMWFYGINAGTHAHPTFAGDTIYCYSVIKELVATTREDLGLIRLRTIGLKNVIPEKIKTPFDEDNKYYLNVVLDLDYTLIIPKKQKKEEF